MDWYAAVEAAAAALSLASFFWKASSAAFLANSSSISAIISAAVISAASLASKAAISCSIARASISSSTITSYVSLDWYAVVEAAAGAVASSADSFGVNTICWGSSSIETINSEQGMVKSTINPLTMAISKELPVIVSLSKKVSKPVLASWWKVNFCVSTS